MAKRGSDLMGRTMETARKQFFASQDVKRCKTTFVGAAGECLACGADQGVACRASLYETAAAQSAPVKAGG